MRFSPRWTMLLSLTLLMPLAAGCMVNHAIAASAVGDNKAVERAQNEVLLLNVLRAKDRAPMYVTDLSLITSSVKAEADLAGSVPLGSYGGGRMPAPVHYSLAPTLSYNWNPNFNINVLDTQDFMTGFMAPVTGDVLAFYWIQGYPREVLLNLMVRRATMRKISVNCPSNSSNETTVPAAVEEYGLENYPDADDKNFSAVADFNRWITAFIDTDPQTSTGDPSAVGPVLPKAPSATELIAAAAANLTVVQSSEGGGFQLEKPGSAVLKIGNGGKLEDLWNTAKQLTTRCQRERIWQALGRTDPGKPTAEDLAKVGCFEVTRSETHHEDVQADICKGDQARAKGGRLEQSQLQDGTSMREGARVVYQLQLNLRSPEAVLYYLGELARVEEKWHRELRLCLQGHVQPLFIVRDDPFEAGSQCSSQVTADSHGKRYWIPESNGTYPACRGDNAAVSEPGAAQAADARTAGSKNGDPQDPAQVGPREIGCQPGLSMQAFSVVNQLIALQKSAKDLQATGVVRVIQ